MMTVPPSTLPTIAVPGAATTTVGGANDLGQIVGSYTVRDSLGTHGFLYANGTYTTLDIPGASSTVITGINDAGVIVGVASGGTGRGAFVETGGRIAYFSIPGATSVTPQGINDQGVITGHFVDSTGQNQVFALQAPPPGAGVPPPFATDIPLIDLIPPVSQTGQVIAVSNVSNVGSVMQFSGNGSVSEVSLFVHT